MALSEKDEALIPKLKEHGLKYPRMTLEEARAVGIPLSFALAFLQQESSGRDADGRSKFGLNLVGNDAVRNIRGGFVTEARYREYLRKRRAGMGMQGIGPLQLTWWEFQDAADRMGGCWKPRFNMRFGFGLAKSLIKKHGRDAGVARYNGTGAAAQQYARSWREKQLEWHRWLLRQE